MNNLEKNKSTQEQKKMMKIINTKTKIGPTSNDNEMTTLLTVHNGGAYNKERTDNAMETN